MTQMQEGTGVKFLTCTYREVYHRPDACRPVLSGSKLSGTVSAFKTMCLFMFVCIHNYCIQNRIFQPGEKAYQADALSWSGD